VDELQPQFAFSDVGELYSFEIRGSNLGTQANTTASVGGQPCHPTEVVSSQLVRCHNVSAPWTSHHVTVTVAGRLVLGRDLFTYLPPPVVQSVTPSRSSTAGGTLLTIDGNGLGRSASDLVGVAIGDQACIDPTFIDPTRVTCTLPPGVGADHQVVVTVVR